MNYGFAGFPSGPDAKIISVTEFDASGYYSVPMNAQSLYIFAVGAGGGGGGGRRAATSASAGGGGGGGGGAQIYLHYLLDDVVVPGSQLNVVIGAGGSGGAGGSADNTNGNAGTAGGDTYIKLNNRAGFLAYAVGGNLGSGGTTSGGAAGAARGSIYFHIYGVLHGGAGSAGSLGTKGTNYSILSARASGLTWHGGSGGGGFTTPSSVAAGTDIIAGTSTSISFVNPILLNSSSGSIVMAGGTADGGVGTSSYRHILGRLTPGIGGAGGGGGNTVGAGVGGNGYRGSGGGGGGGSKVGFAAAAGGKGGNGYVCIVAL